MVTFESIIEAYRDCLRHKQGKSSAMDFDINREELLWSLYEDIASRRYSASPSIAFVVTVPKPREVFAADFRYRIVHHWIALRIEPILSWMLIPNTYSCIKRRGNLAMQRDVLQCVTENRDKWVMKIDVSGFFNSIDKETLWHKMRSLIEQYYEGEDKEELLWLLGETVYNDPTIGCRMNSKKSLWELVPKNRTLFGDSTRGLAIGNLVSQLYANYYMNDIDHYFYGKMTGYFRYVDDIIMVDEKQRLLTAREEMRTMLADLSLTMNDKKFYLQHASKGIDACGRFVKPNRMHARRSTVNRAMQRLSREDCTAETLNSYLGLFRHGNTYKTRMKIVNSTNESVLHKGYFDKNLTKYTAYEN